MFPDTFLLSYTGFDIHNAPIIDAQVNDTISHHPLLNQTLTFTFDKSVRYCTGWFDVETHQVYPCPKHIQVEEKYEQCLECRNKTGFNPAFYYAKTISDRQQAINQNPHFLYLAYFAPGLMKVGISQEARGIRRLLEQGARIAMKLETFPTAEIARQYEAKIAALDGIVEHIVARKKLDVLKIPFNETEATDELRRTQESISLSLGLSFDKAEIIQTTPFFHCSGIDMRSITIMKNQPTIVGTVKAVIGHIVILQHADRLLAYNLKSFVGYQAAITNADLMIDLPSEQMALF